ncbi:predicted protein [Pyrenophora tritici-repentis Pt-1C-BFP]|uniref:Uncharacterized protein n=1 Tax=Pyrenophora tritici-repentis (strain Pt-1C-BFP) TaxID=426418 RepID=B2WJE4_PYRTR|nr:uncharacterized protein PTRG_10103 [Pyrenophora tritici-repentis Pt-1C-BFP]EDU43154.1 predicted protein [Pyrenophora tritici-repentis Pt-1C-BFP]
MNITILITIATFASYKTSLVTDAVDTVRQCHGYVEEDESGELHFCLRVFVDEWVVDYFIAVFSGWHPTIVVSFTDAKG